ncbi:MAG: hypothetical protein ABEJ36_00130 [Candidatus Nanosalina sp.]
MDEMSYHLADQHLYTEKALEFLESRQEEVDAKLANGGPEFAPSYAFFQGEIDTLEDYTEALNPYHEFLQDAYEDISSVQRPETVLGRVEEDMDMMARERNSRLDDTTPTGVSRREAFDQVFSEEEYDRPVLSDTWIMMNEAERLRKSL